jgi:hypothetical protein
VKGGGYTSGALRGGRRYASGGGGGALLATGRERQLRAAASCSARAALSSIACDGYSFGRARRSMLACEHTELRRAVDAADVMDAAWRGLLLGLSPAPPEAAAALVLLGSEDSVDWAVNLKSTLLRGEGEWWLCRELLRTELLPLVVVPVVMSIGLM